MKMNDKISGLYKLCCDDDNDYGACLVEQMEWKDDALYAWIPYSYLYDFMDGIENLFGYDLFDDGGFNASMQANSVCINLSDVLDDYVDLKYISPK